MALVLVLEDDAGLRFAFSEALEDAGHQVLPAADPDAAIAFLKRQVPDVLLLDLMIGGSYSTDVANYAAFAAPNAHVVYVTGSGLFPKGELFDMCQNARCGREQPEVSPLCRVGL